MELVGIQIYQLTEGMQRLSGEVRYDDGETENYWFDLPAEYNVSDTGNPWVALLLPLAVTIGEDLRISIPVDPVLLDATDDLVKLWKTWYPYLHDIKVYAKTATINPIDNLTTTFFSSGVDSYFTALQRPRAKNMILTRGFDMPYKYVSEFKVHFDRLSVSARECGGKLIPTATNIREMRWSKCHWELIGHGPALAAIALLFEKYFSEVYIPSSYEYGSLHPWASHPMVDVLFTTSTLRFIHHGCGYSRTEKIKYLSDFGHVLSHLHVCFRGGDGTGQDELNCCNCEKCYRTMIVLELLGKLKSASMFKETEVNLTKVGLLYGDMRFLNEVLSFALEVKNHEIASALKRSIRRSRRLDLLKKCNNVPFFWRISNNIYSRALSKSLI
jgi:hypothetical protein